MKRFDRYILGVFGISWAVSMVFFLGMYVVIHFFNRMRSLESVNATFRSAGITPFQGFVTYYALNAPFIAVLMLPFTILMGAMWTVQHMGRRNEIVPILSAGVSLKRMILPLLVAAFLMSLLAAGLRERVLPDLALARDRYGSLIRGRDSHEMSRLPIIKDGAGRRFCVGSYDVVARVARMVSLLHTTSKAEALVYDEAGPQGPGWYPLPGTDVQGDARVFLETDLIPLDIEVQTRSLLHLDVPGLRRLIARDPGRPRLQVLLQSLYAYPLGALILLLLGLPLALRTERRSPFIAAGMALLLSIVFFAAQSIASEVGAKGELLSPILAAWLPIVVFGALGLILFESMRT